MSYTVDDGAILEVSFRGRYAEQRMISLFHYRFENGSGPVNGASEIALIDPLINQNIDGRLLKEYLKCCNAEYNMEEVVYQWLWPTRRPRVVRIPASVPGQLVGTAAPSCISAALTKRTDIAGRKGVGTLHMPALTMENISGSSFTLLGLATYSTMLEKLHEVINIDFGQNLHPVLLHRVAPDQSPEITGATSNFTVRTAHRRTVGVGE